MRMQFFRSLPRCTWLFAAAFAAFFSTSTPAQAQLGGASQLIPQATAQRYGLNRAWFTQAALDKHRTRVGSWALQGDTLFLQTTQNIVQAIAAETGRTLWTVQVGEPGKPTGMIQASKTVVGVVNGSWIYLLDRQNGQVIWQREMESIPLGGVAVTDEWVYIPLSNGRMRAIPFRNPDKKHEPWWRGAAGRIEDAPIATQSCLIWNNDRGMMLASELDKSHLIFQFEMNGPLTAPLSYWPPYAFLVDRQFVFAVDVSTKRSQGRMAWQFSPNGRISAAPIPGPDRLYLVLENGGMYCVQTGFEAGKELVTTTTAPIAEAEEPADGEEAAPTPKSDKPVFDTKHGRLPGELIWFAPNVKQFIAAGPERLFAEDQNGDILILNAQTGVRIATFPSDPEMIKMVNPYSDRMYLATRNGLLQCLHDIHLDKPVMYSWPAAPDAKAGPAAAIQQDAGANDSEPAAAGEPAADDAN